MDYHERMRQYYDRLAPDYDRSAASREEAVKDLPGLLRAISLLPPARVLDVACGTGSLTPHLGPEVTELDQSEAMLEVARERTPRANFVLGDALRMPSADNSSDRVFSSFFYGLLPLPDRERQQTEVRRVADELILTEPTPEWESEGRTEEWEQRVLPDGSRYEIYRRQFTAESLAGEIGGRILFEGRWVAMSAVGGQNPTSSPNAGESILEIHIPDRALTGRRRQVGSRLPKLGASPLIHQGEVKITLSVDMPEQGSRLLFHRSQQTRNARERIEKMLKEEIPHHTFESDKAPFAIPSGDERELLLLLAIQEAGAVQARSLEEAAIDEAAISTQAEEALVMG